MINWTKKQLETAETIDKSFAQVERYFWDDLTYDIEDGPQMLAGIAEHVAKIDEGIARLPIIRPLTQDLAGVLGRVRDEIFDVRFDLCMFEENSHEYAEELYRGLRKLGARNLAVMRELRHRLAYEVSVASVEGGKPAKNRTGRRRSHQKALEMAWIKKIRETGRTKPREISDQLRKKYNSRLTARQVSQRLQSIKKGDLEKSLAEGEKLDTSSK